MGAAEAGFDPAGRLKETSHAERHRGGGAVNAGKVLAYLIALPLLTRPFLCPMEVYRKPHVFISVNLYRITLRCSELC
jgi:hypothetical protein